MPAAFSTKEIAEIAALAHLELDPAETDRFATQLGEILAYVAALDEVDTTNVPPTARVAAAHLPERDDVVRPSIDREAALAAAPDAARDAGLFKVPRVMG
jgi:aspartyl-tRNA(Asn)/glutamyl-tRNA(Gln) amidotransferase subunit C